MAQTQQEQTAGSSSPQTAPDPLAALHKMSTTAGLGSTDYVAVNPTAIFALIVGLASALTLFDEPLLLVIPLVGIVTTIIAFRQIARSSGTQTGRGIALLALALCLCFGATVFGRTLASRTREHRDKADIGRLIENLDRAAREGTIDAAYALFDSRFRERVAVTTFGDRLKAVHENDYWGKLKGISWKNLAAFEVDESTDTRVAFVQLIVDSEKTGERRMDAIFRNVEGKWCFDDIPSLFPAEKAPAR